MFYQFKDRLRRRIFGWRVGFLLKTAPVVTGSPSGPLVLSQLQHKDVLMYLAAIKSFARRVPVAQVHVVDDGSLSPEDRHLLSFHVPGIRFLTLAECRDPRLPVGGTWERLIAIARLSESHYVVQLDADTLSVGDMEEVVRACQENRSFTIGTWNGQTIEPVAISADRARQALQRTNTHQHVQLVAEANFDRFTRANELRYVRGCSGFAGFGRGGFKLELMYELSDQLRALLGDTWNNWGSEQVMSNLVVANQADAFVLPHPDYSDCEKMQPGQTRFVHFIGTCRFQGGRYANMIRAQAWG